jgi:O-antigen ligase
MIFWMVALLFILLGWWRIAATRQMSSIVVPGVTLAGVFAASSTVGHYDRALAVLAMVGAVSVMRGHRGLAQIWRRLQPWLSLSIVLVSASLWPRTWYINIYASWLLLLYSSSAWPVTVAGMLATRSISASAGLVVAWLSPRWMWIGLPVILVVAVIVRPASLIERLSIWSESIRLFAARPVTGWGTSAYYLSLRRDLGMVRSTGYGHAHNALLTVAVENGVVGVIPMLWLVYRMWKQSGHRAGLVAFAFQQLLDDTWLDPLSAVLLGLQLGCDE